MSQVVTTTITEEKGAHAHTRKAATQRTLNKRYQRVGDYDRRRKELEKKREEAGNPKKKFLSSKTLRKKRRQFYTTKPDGCVGVLIERRRLQCAIKQHTEENTKLMERLKVLYPKLNLSTKQSKGAVNVKLHNLDRISHDIYAEIATHVTDPRTGAVKRVTEQHAEIVFNRRNL